MAEINKDTSVLLYSVIFPNAAELILIQTLSQTKLQKSFINKKGNTFNNIFNVKLNIK